MAGDWIKMRTNLFTHPKVVRMASALKADTLRTVGGLMSVWCLFDSHSEDGCLEGYSPDVLDDQLRWAGFSTAMVAVGWLEYDPEIGLSLPRFDTHNGQSAKRRAQDADRKREVRKVSASEADKTGTREEKKREEISTPDGVDKATRSQRSRPADRPDDVSEGTWSDFLAIRKAKRAPLTATALEGIEREAGKAGLSLEQALRECCTRGWQGFNAEWVQPRLTPAQKAVDISRMTVPGPTGPDPTLLKIAEDRRRAVPMPESVRAAMQAMSRRAA